MKLQLALDMVDVAEAKEIIQEVKDYIDIVEIGTPFAIKSGISALTELKEEFPDLTFLADLKIMDAGEYEAKVAFDAGADIVTVLGVSNDVTISNTVKVAKQYNGKVLADLIEVKDIKKRAVELEELGVDYLCIHTAFDVQGLGKDPLEELKELVSCVDSSKAAVAGGVNLSTIGDIAKLNPEIIIVGGALTRPDDKKAVAKKMKDTMKNI